MWVLNSQTRSADRPSLKYSSGGSGPLWKWNEAFCLAGNGGGQYCVTFQCSQGSEGLSLVSKKRIKGYRETDKRIFGYQGDKKRSTAQETIIHKTNDQTDALSTAHKPSVLVSQKSTNTPSKSTSRTSRHTRTTETQGELFQKNSQTSIFSAADFLARLSRLLESGVDLKILEELYSMKLHESPELKDLSYCSWKTSKDFSHTIKGEPLEQSSQPFLEWGIFSNGRYLTARISVSHKTGKECSLSDILEVQVDERYFLSQNQQDKLLKEYNQMLAEKVTQANKTELT